MVAVFKQGDKFYFARQDGCSCDSAFSYSGMGALEPLVNATWSAFEHEVHELSDYYATSIQKVQFLADITREVKQ